MASVMPKRDPEPDSLRRRNRLGRSRLVPLEFRFGHRTGEIARSGSQKALGVSANSRSNSTLARRLSFFCFDAVRAARSSDPAGTTRPVPWHPKKGCRQRAVKAISRSQSNDGYDADCGRSRGASAGVLSAQLMRPRPRSGTSASRRLRPSAGQRRCDGVDSEKRTIWSCGT
jgi:hypothetical protein